MTRQRRAPEPRGRLHAMRRTPTIVAVLTLSSLALMSSCTNADGKTTPPTTSASTTSTPSTTSSTLSPAERDASAAQATLIKFWSLHDQLATDLKSSLNRLATIARGQALAQMRTTLFRQRLKGWRQVGITAVVSTSAKPTGSQRYDVTACLDVSNVNVVNRKGESVLEANRPPRTRVAYVVEDTTQGWFVIRDKFQVTTC
jgi:hypothetical protein